MKSIILKGNVITGMVRANGNGSVLEPLLWQGGGARIFQERKRREKRKYVMY